MAISPVQALTLTRGEPYWPEQLQNRLNTATPACLCAIGKPVRCPGSAIFAAHDAARQLRDDRVAVISGFHSPVEKEFLRILLRGKRPIIVCFAQAFGKIRIPTDWRPALKSGRLLLLSPFERSPRRPDTKSARRTRRRFVG